MSEATTATKDFAPSRVESKRDRHSHSTRNALLCALAVAACVLIANPTADMSFLDDFSYAKTALDFARTGHIVYNGWATAMLGWLIPWGALFIKLFGFSFNILRLSMLPIAMATVYLFHQILLRFGINPRNAILGALTMGLSPLFLPMAASYMTDIPGLFVILVCIYMCQRAVAARSDRAALLWLCSAMLANVAGGTVRQIAWLGALVMVPATAWLLRDRRGMKIAGVLLWILTLAGVLACMHWFSRQPYSVPDYFTVKLITLRTLFHLAAQLLKAFLCLLLVIFPVFVAWLPTARRLNRNAWLRFIGAIALLTLLAIIPYRSGQIGGWLAPWLNFLLAMQGNLVSSMFGETTLTAAIWIRAVISLLVIAPFLLLMEPMVRRKPYRLPNTDRHATSWNQIFWILGPFSLSYVILLVPSGTFSFIWDRYLLGLVPAAIVILLRLYQERIAEKLSTVSLVALAIFAAYAVAGSHDLFAKARAESKTMRMIQNSGVPRRSIQAGFPDDGWAQIQNGGHLNDRRIRIPAGAYNPRTPDFGFSKNCAPRYWFMPYTPSIVPKYFVLSSPMPCLAPTKYPPVQYRAWLPPFRRAYYVQKKKE